MSSEGKYLICLDPRTNHQYLLSLSDNHVEVQWDLSPDSRGFYDDQLAILETLRGFETADWHFNSIEYKNYRRRRIKPHLLQPDAYPFPAYTTSKELSSAFAEETDVRLIVDISEYMGEAMLNYQGSEDDTLSQASYSVLYNTEQKSFNIKACLVASANEVVKGIIRHVYKKYGHKIRAKGEDNQLVLKVTGKLSYFTGNHPILAYKVIRTSLRECTNVNLILKEIPKNWESEFPPYFTKERYRTIIPEIVKPTFFWYSPIDLPSNKDRAVSEAFRNKFQTDATDSINLRFEPELLSGENDWPLRFTIKGADSLFLLFSSAFWGKACHNGFDPPEYVVLPGRDKKTDKHKSKSDKSNQSSQQSVRSSSILSTNFKLKPKGSVIGSTRGTNTQALNSAFLNHGPTNSLSIDLKNTFKLPFDPYMLSFEVMLLYGEEIFKGCIKEVKYSPFNYYPRCNDMVSFNLKVSETPRECRIGINIYAHSRKAEKIVIGCTAKTLFDDKGYLRSGLVGLQIWPFYRLEPRLACMQEFYGSTLDNSMSASIDKYTNIAPSQFHEEFSQEYGRIYIEFESYINDNVKWSLRNSNKMKDLYGRVANSTRLLSSTEALISWRRGILKAVEHQEEFEIKVLNKKPTIEDLANLEKVLCKDPLQVLTFEDKKLLFLCRDHYKTLPLTLPLFLKSVDWSKPTQVEEAYRMIRIWSHMPPEDALCLLNADFPDETVRLYGVKRIACFADDELALFLPQITQGLFFECQHHTPLSELILERALRSPYTVGHDLYWNLRSQMHIKAVAERAGAILEQYIMLCGSYREVIYREVNATTKFIEFGNVVVETKSTDKTAFLKKYISENREALPEHFSLPIDSSISVKGIILEKCKVMGSKKVPIWLHLKNSDIGGVNEQLIFKCGDDLRQDILTLQLIRVMDSLWLENGLDLKMRPYSVVPTGDMQGAIEVVTNSMTVADIQDKFGGLLGALKKDPLREYLMMNNPDEMFMVAIDNFIKSCAGYSVATYILGIGDRHADNYMISKTGHYFHIDFGHFLGNFKSKGGVKRERVPFVFTKEMAYVMGGMNSEGFNQFNSLCCRAYNIIRKNGWKLINLFLLMQSAGMPELKRSSDIEYMRNMLSLQFTDMEAEAKFKKEIINSMNSRIRTLDNLIHNLKHK